LEELLFIDQGKIENNVGAFSSLRYNHSSLYNKSRNWQKIENMDHFFSTQIAKSFKDKILKTILLKQNASSDSVIFCLKKFKKQFKTHV
jgi:hypothetical protein